MKKDELFDELFDELYGVCFATVSRIIEKALDHPLTEKEIRAIIKKNAFGECVQYIEAHLIGKKQNWNLITEDGETGLKNAPSLPLTMLQKRWLKTISLDPRMKLFGEEIDGLDGIEPLFTAEDYLVFDKYSDGDPYDDENYIENFQVILKAIENKSFLRIQSSSAKGEVAEQVILPKYLEYSEKDDKFRLIGTVNSGRRTINLARIISCERCEAGVGEDYDKKGNAMRHKVVFEVHDVEGTLEKVLLHFAHLKKRVEKLEDINHYKVSIVYDKNDENEMVIRILSFGSKVKVVESDNFIKLIRKKLLDQKSCEH